MGRGKLKLELIPNEKSRKTTFEKRSKGLMKKCNELSTLCNVDVCMVINDGGGPTSQQPQRTYPKNTEEVNRIIQRYLTTTKDNPPKKMSGLSDFFMDQKKKIDSELSKLYKAKYPVSDELIDRYCPNGNSEELLRFMNLLDERIKEAEQMVNAKKQNQHDHDDHVDHGLYFDQDQHYPIPFSSFQAPDDQFVSNHMTNIGQGHGYQNYASHAPSTSNYINIDHYYHQGCYNNNPMSGSGPVVDDPTVVGMQENYKMFGNNNSNGNPSSSSSSPSMMMMQYCSDQLPPLATIMPPYMQYASMPLQLPGIPFDHHHQQQQQIHGYYDYNEQKGKKVDENIDFLFENNQ